MANEQLNITLQIVADPSQEKIHNPGIQK